MVGAVIRETVRELNWDVSIEEVKLDVEVEFDWLALEFDWLEAAELEPEF